MSNNSIFLSKESNTLTTPINEKNKLLPSGFKNIYDPQSYANKPS